MHVDNSFHGVNFIISRFSIEYTMCAYYWGFRLLVRSIFSVRVPVYYLEFCLKSLCLEHNEAQKKPESPFVVAHAR